MRAAVTAAVVRSTGAPPSPRALPKHRLRWFRRNHLFQKIAIWDQSTAGVAMVGANRPAVYGVSIKDIPVALPCRFCF
jgi:hypothetical protein